MNTTRTVTSLALAGVLALSACGSSPETEAEAAPTATIDPAMAEAEEARQEAESALSASESQLESVEAQLAESEAEASGMATEIEALSTERDDAVAAQEAAEAERDEAAAEAERLRTEYDPQIRAGLQAEVDGEILRATGVAIAEIDTPIDDIVEWKPTWEPVASKQAIVDQVTANAAPERNKTAEQREADRFAAYETVNVDAVVKNPNEYEGRGVLMWADIVQWDANTGTCSFHANFLGHQGGRFDYDERGQFGYGDTELVQAFNEDCPDLSGIDQDDIVKIWATGAGSYSYSTSIGGTNTVPLFSIDKIELIEKK